MTHDLPLVQALTRHAFAHTEAAAITGTKPNVVSILTATAKAADEAARLVQFNQLDQLTPRQLQIIKEVQTHE